MELVSAMVLAGRIGGKEWRVKVARKDESRFTIHLSVVGSFASLWQGPFLRSQCLNIAGLTYSLKNPGQNTFEKV